MSKYLLLLIAIALCVSPVLAQDDPKEGPVNPYADANAEKYMTEVKKFAEDYLQDVDGYSEFSVEKFVSDLDTVAQSVPEGNGNKFEVSKFFTGLAKEVSENAKDLKGDKQKGFKKKVAELVVKGYLDDMKNKEIIDTEDYLNDISHIKEEFVETELADPVLEKSNLKPGDFLDKVIKRYGAAKIDVVWMGIDRHWYGTTMYQVLQAFKKKFSHSSLAQGDFAWLENLWPQSAESYLMNSSYDGTIYDTQITGNGQSFSVDEYGTMMNDDQKSDESYNSQFQSGSYMSTTDRSYNNRSWGYKNGNFTTIKLTTNGHTYELKDHFYTSPLVLDMDGDGKLQASHGKWLPHPYKGAKVIEFDMNGDGFIDLTEWVGPQDGLLLVYKSGKVDANNLFGNAGGYDTGYEKLSLLDKDEDGKLSGDELKTLSVWQDKNGNAKVDSGEIKSVVDLEITQINVKHDKYLVSSFVQGGVQKKVWDWYPKVFDVKRRK